MKPVAIMALKLTLSGQKPNKEIDNFVDKESHTFLPVSCNDLRLFFMRLRLFV